MSLCVGFQYIENCRLLCLRCIDISRKLIDSYCSFSKVKFIVGCSLLNSLSVFHILHITDKYNKSGIYQMKCMECPRRYVGQTGRNFSIRYKEHTHDIRSNNSNTGYSNHVLNTGHTYGTITDTMEIKQQGKK
jgi:hypothetical protein